LTARKSTSFIPESRCRDREVPLIVILPLSLLIAGLALGLVFLVIGLQKKNKTNTGVGSTLMGITGLSFALAIAYYDFSRGGTFCPSATYMMAFAAVVFLSGMATAFGYQQLATSNSR